MSKRKSDGASYERISPNFCVAAFIFDVNVEGETMLIIYSTRPTRLIARTLLFDIELPAGSLLRDALLERQFRMTRREMFSFFFPLLFFSTTCLVNRIARAWISERLHKIG